MRAYLDNNATTALHPLVRERLLEVLDVGPLNPGSMHGTGQVARRLMEDAGRELVQAVGLEGRKVVWCGSATEAVNIVIRSALGAPGAVIVHSSVDHPATKETAALGSARSVAVGRDGELDMAELGKALQGATLAAFMVANNETGALFAIEEIAAMCRGAGVPLLLDACQAPGKCELEGRLAAANPDFLILSGHKIHGPTGVAALMIAPGKSLQRQVTGGGQQHGMRAGTEPVALACALARACSLAMQADLAPMRAQVDRLWRAIRAAAPGAIATIAEPARRLANTLHYRVGGLTAERQVIAFDLAGVHCSSASACESGAVLPSKVMLGMGFSESEAKEGVRLSVGRLTSDAEVGFACEQIGTVLRRLLRPESRTEEAK